MAIFCLCCLLLHAARCDLVCMAESIRTYEISVLTLPFNPIMASIITYRRSYISDSFPFSSCSALFFSIFLLIQNILCPGWSIYDFKVVVFVQQVLPLSSLRCIQSLNSPWDLEVRYFSNCSSYCFQLASNFFSVYFTYFQI